MVFVNIVAHHSINIPAQKFGTFCYAWNFLHDIQNGKSGMWYWPSLVPRLLPYRNTGKEPGKSDHVPCDVLCVVLCVVLIIKLLPTQSVLSDVSADMAIVVCC